MGVHLRIGLARSPAHRTTQTGDGASSAVLVLAVGFHSLLLDEPLSLSEPVILL